MKWGSDGGGFNQNTGTTENPSPELYARWLQFAAFSPVFRVHGNFQHQRQPWYYGFSAEEASKAVIQLRYALMPYIYSLAGAVHFNDYTNIRRMKRASA